MFELNENQARVYTDIEQEISKIKSDARKLYRKEPVKQVKHVTEEIRQVYYSEDVCNNQKYLLRRYAKLEKKDIIWGNIWIPTFLSIVSVDLIFEKFSEITSMVLSLVKALMLIEKITLKEALVVIIGISTIIFLICLLIRSLKALYDVISGSLTRSADTTITENELKIISAILHHHSIFLDDEKKKTVVAKLFDKK